MADFHSPHASLSGFGEAYEAHIVEETRQIEKYARFGLMGLFGLIIVGLVGMFGHLTDWLFLAEPSTTSLIIHGLTTLFVVGTTSVAALQFGLHLVRLEYKKAIFPIFRELFGWRFEKSDTQTMNIAALEAFHLLPEHHDAQFKSHLTGQIGQARLVVSDLMLTKRNGKSQKTVFTGTVMKFTFPRAFKVDTIVLNDLGWRNKKVISKKTIRRGLFQKADTTVFEHDPTKLLSAPSRDVRADRTYDRVELLSPEFEKRFEVYGTDQVESRVLLSPEIIDNLTRMAESVDGRRLRFAFIDRSLLVVFEEPSVFSFTPIMPRISHERFAQSILDEVSAMIYIVQWVESQRGSFERKRRENREVA